MLGQFETFGFFLLEEIILIRQEPLGISLFIKVLIFKNFVARNYS